MPLVILAVGILILFFLIVKVKLNSFLALLLVAGIVGLAEGMPIDQLIPTIEKGLGGTLGGLAIVVSFGAMLGKLMAESGGAQRIATTLINAFGREKVKWAVCLTGFIVGIALFYEIGFVLLIPLALPLLPKPRFLYWKSVFLWLRPCRLPTASCRLIRHRRPFPSSITPISA